MNLDEMATLQEEMAAKVHIPPDGSGWQLQPGMTVLSLDVQYVGDTGYVAIDKLRFGSGPEEIFAVTEAVTEPYVPGFFAFREGPVLRNALHKVIEWMGTKPDLIVVDGHGTAHPRKFGVACWLGLEMGLPTIGCAKETLVRYTGELAEAVGSRLPVVVEGDTVGHVLRTALGVKPVFVSPGHAVSLEESVRVISALGAGYRVIEPLRRADQACRSYAKGEHSIALTYMD